MHRHGEKHIKFQLHWYIIEENSSQEEGDGTACEVVNQLRA